MIVLLLSNCATTDNSRKAFKFQVLFAHPNYPGHLTNQIPKDEGGWDVLNYSFKDAKFRQDADAVGFWCMIQKKHWFICTDKPGLCRTTKKCLKKEWKGLRRKCVKYEMLYLDGIEDFHTMVRSRLICRVIYQNN
jgi:hypothetical protein